MVMYLQERLDRVFSALSDPTRREILTSLANHEHSVLQLVDLFEMSQPAVTKHLRVLQKAGLVMKKKDGRYRHCRLQTISLRVASRWIEYVRQEWEDNFDMVDAYGQSEVSSDNAK